MKRKNKQAINFSVVAILALAAGGGVSYMAFGGGGGNKTNIAFVANNGKIWDDGSFNTGSHNGVTEYTDNVEHARLKTDTSGEYDALGTNYIEPTIKSLNAGNDMVVSAGFNFAPAITGQPVMVQALDDNGDPIFDPDEDGELTIPRMVQDVDAAGDLMYHWDQGIYGAPIEGSNRSTNWGDRTIVLADDTATDLASIYSNAVSINYNSQGGGLITGVASAIYSTAVQTKVPVETKDGTTYDDNKIRKPKDGDHLTNVVVPYGGFPINVVYDYMSGFEQGVNWYNYVVLGYTPWDHVNTKPKVGEITDDSVQAVNALNNGQTGAEFDQIAAIEVAAIPTDNKIDEGKKIIYASDNYGQDETKAVTDFNNFEILGFPDSEQSLEGQRVEEISTSAVEWDVPVIFPVAGASTMYTYQALYDGNAHGQDGNYTQVLGVDSDSVKVEADDNGYTEYDSYILGSSVKNLEMSIQYAVWYADEKQEGVYVAQDMDGDEDKIDPSGTIHDSTDFMKPVSEGGWNQSADVNTDLNEDGSINKDNDLPGQQFTGNLANGGSYFTPGVSDNGDYELRSHEGSTGADKVIIDYFGITKDEITLTFMKDLAEEQNPIFEASSQTFSPDPVFYNTERANAALAEVEGLTGDWTKDMPWMINYNMEDVLHNK